MYICMSMAFETIALTQSIFPMSFDAFVLFFQNLTFIPDFSIKCDLTLV